MSQLTKYIISSHCLMPQFSSFSDFPRSNIIDIVLIMDYILTLPFEILETILVFAVTPVASPISTSSYTGMPVLRWEEELNLKESILVQSLSPRLVSSRFYEASWRPFATVLGETIFDLRSRDSLANLMAVSSCPDLATWFRKLTIGFYSAPNESRGQHVNEKLSLAGQEKLQSICEVENSWWPDVLQWEDDKFSQDEGTACSTNDDDDGAEWFLQTVARCLTALTNLDDVCYSFDMRIFPARYKPIIQHLFDAADFQLDPRTSPKIQRRGCQGLDLLFQALALSQTSPSRLDISMPLCSGTVVSTLPPVGLQRVLRNVSDLTIRSSELIDFDPWNLLQHSCKSAEKVNSVERLSIIITDEDEKSLLPDELWSVDHIPLLVEKIKAMNVRCLRLQIGTDASWAHTDYQRWHTSDSNEMMVKPVSWLDGLAKIVHVRPQGFCTWLKRYGAWDSRCCACYGEEEARSEGCVQ